MDSKVIPTLCESGIDFLRLSLSTDAPDYEEWHSTFSAFEQREALEDQPPVQYSMAYYRMTGYGDVSHGVLNKKGLFNASGPIAHEIMEVTKNRRFTGTCTRCDAKVSAQYGEEEWKAKTRDLARLHWADTEAGGCAQADSVVFDSTTKGNTLYLGSRRDASFARIYQACKRHPDRYEPNTLSFEIQHNKKTADVAFNMLRSSANLHTCAGSMVTGRLLSFGVREAWLNQMPPSHVMQRKHYSTKEGTLKWVRSSVRGAFLRANREGWTIEFIDKLGFGTLNASDAQRIIEVLEAQNSGYETFGE